MYLPGNIGAPASQGHLRSAQAGLPSSHHNIQPSNVAPAGVQKHRRALPPAPILPLHSLRSVAPPIYYNSSGNSSTSSSAGYTTSGAESFVDQNLKRSVSNVNPKNRPAPIAKPVRRSKSQRTQQNFVTSIQHGGSVTLVSLNGENKNGKPSSEIKHVHHHHFVQDWDQIGGSQTLPNRKGSKKIAPVKPLSADDSQVVIKKQGLNGVKIQLNLNEQEKQVQTSLDFDHDDHLKNDSADNKVAKRKYTLEELEVEGFESTSSSKNSDFEEEVDLNSLIEGDVDEIDEEIGKLNLLKFCFILAFFLKIEGFWD